MMMCIIEKSQSKKHLKISFIISVLFFIKKGIEIQLLMSFLNCPAFKNKPAVNYLEDIDINALNLKSIEEVKIEEIELMEQEKRTSAIRGLNNAMDRISLPVEDKLKSIGYHTNILKK